MSERDATEVIANLLARVETLESAVAHLQNMCVDRTTCPECFAMLEVKS